MRLNELEKLILDNMEDKDFVKALKEISDLTLKLETIDVRKEEVIEENSYVVESTVGEYLEEISHITQLTKGKVEALMESIDEEESLHELVEGKLRDVANIAFDYYYSGIDFLDLIQEGNIGLMKALENYKTSNGELSNYINIWVRKEMYIFVARRLEEEKQMFLGYFTKRREEVLEHEIVAELEDETESLETEDKVEIINAKIKKVEALELNQTTRKMSKEEEDVIKKYYGLVGEKRESIFEIENSLEIVRGTGEELFDKSLTKLSLGGGRMLNI